MPERLWGISDIARARDVSAQVVANWYARQNGRLPKPSYLGPNDAPLWRRSLLERIGLIPAGEAEDARSLTSDHPS